MHAKFDALKRFEPMMRNTNFPRSMNLLIYDCVCASNASPAHVFPVRSEMGNEADDRPLLDGVEGETVVVVVDAERPIAGNSG